MKRNYSVMFTLLALSSFMLAPDGVSSGSSGGPPTPPSPEPKKPNTTGDVADDPNKNQNKPSGDSIAKPVGGEDGAGAGRTGNSMPEPGHGTSAGITSSDIRANPDVDDSETPPHSVTESRGQGDGTPVDKNGAPSDSGDARGEGGSGDTPPPDIEYRA